MKVLFFAEAVTLAHVARPLVLMSSLREGAAMEGKARSPAWDVAMACAESHHRFIAAQGWSPLPLRSIPSARFLDALAAGRPAYDRQTLERYVADDLKIIADFGPDLVVGDFRLSLSVSARLAGVPYACLTNAYWSPFAEVALPMPVIPMSRHLPLGWARQLFDWGSPLAIRAHCEPLNSVRRAHGLPDLAPGLRSTYADGDHVLYADAPGLCAMRALPANHHFLGPVIWSPRIELPTWWPELRDDLPVVYLNLGGSGSADAASQVVTALSGGAPCAVMWAGSGSQPGDSGTTLASSTLDLRCADYLPGDLATSRADLVICNGGSMTCQQALLAGKPILGIASNMDQFLNMTAIVDGGAGICLRADRLSVPVIRQAVDALFSDTAYAVAARSLGHTLQHWDAASRFRSILPSLLESNSAALI